MENSTRSHDLVSPTHLLFMALHSRVSALTGASPARLGSAGTLRPDGLTSGHVSRVRKERTLPRGDDSSVACERTGGKGRLGESKRKSSVL